MASTFPSARTMSFFKAGICGSSWLFTFPEGLLYFPYIPEHDSVFLVAQMLRRPPTMQKTGFDPWVGKVLWRNKWQSTPVLLPGKSHGWRSVVGYSPWGHKESDMTERLHFTSNINGVLAPRESRGCAQSELGVGRGAKKVGVSEH